MAVAAVKTDGYVRNSWFFSPAAAFLAEPSAGVTSRPTGVGRIELWGAASPQLYARPTHLSTWFRLPRGRVWAFQCVLAETDVQVGNLAMDGSLTSK